MAYNYGISNLPRHFIIEIPVNSLDFLKMVIVHTTYISYTPTDFRVNIKGDTNWFFTDSVGSGEHLWRLTGNNDFKEYLV